MKLYPERISYHLRINVVPTIGMLAAMVLAMAWVGK